MATSITLRLPDDGIHTGRTLTFGVIKRLDEGSLTFLDGLGCGVPDEIMPRLTVGELIGVETKGPMFGGTICGWWGDADVPFSRKTDADLDDDRRKFSEDMDRRHREELEANREDWQRREDALPDWIKARLQHFHEKGGEYFAANGWGYELVIAELAAIFAKDTDWDAWESYKDDPESIDPYSGEHGCSGNQVDCARMLARSHCNAPEQTLAGTIGGLSPITGDAFYEGRSKTP